MTGDPIHLNGCLLDDNGTSRTLNISLVSGLDKMLKLRSKILLISSFRWSMVGKNQGDSFLLSVR